MPSGSSTVVHLDTVTTRDLARRLGSLRCFLDAAQELLARCRLPCSEFRRHSREIISMIEISRTTLTRAGIKLYRFASCPSGLLPYKSAYFELLALLHHNRYNIELDMRDCVARLLFVLSTRFVIVRKGDSSQLNWSADIDAWSRWRINPAKSGRPYLVSSSTAHEPARYASLMPPPDAFPPGRCEFSINTEPRGRPQPIRRDPNSPQREARTAIPRRQTPRPNAATENTPPTPASRPSTSQNRRSFGIFCTAKRAATPALSERNSRR